MIDIEVDSSHCNICKLKISGDTETSCPSHFGVLNYLWNQQPEYRDYQQFLINKKRQQNNLPAIEFQPRSKKFGE
jgi:hypothetical protein